jgi:rSAM/selenodomain-associated transferase 2
MMVSVIIPTLNEEGYLTDCLNSLRHTESELIVVDGGSADHTVALAESLDAKVIVSDIANRGKQMNLGAAAARGELLLFFHADSRLAAGGMESMIAAMRDPEILGGGFSLGFYPESNFYNCLAAGANLFCKITRMLFGDRGMFIRAERFRQIGAFPETAIMEDAALATTMRRSGKITILPDVVMTSARKYKNETKLQALYRTVWAYAAYRLGVSAETIKSGYYGLDRKCRY